MPMPDAVYLDTCAIYGIAVADTLLNLAEKNLYEPKWSHDVMQELHRNLVSNAGLTEAKASQRIEGMQRFFGNAEVTNYRHLESSLTCDPKDRHVLAAAIASGASTLVTFNLKDFPPASTAPYDINVVHPDDFLRDQLKQHPETTLAVIGSQAESKRNPPMSVPELLDRLTKAGVPRFATDVRRQLGLIDPQAGVAPAHEAVRTSSAAPEGRRQQAQSASERDLTR